MDGHAVYCGPLGQRIENLSPASGRLVFSSSGSIILSYLTVLLAFVCTSVAAERCAQEILGVDVADVFPSTSKDFKGQQFQLECYPPAHHNQIPNGALGFDWLYCAQGSLRCEGVDVGNNKGISFAMNRTRLVIQRLEMHHSGQYECRVMKAITGSTIGQSSTTLAARGCYDLNVHSRDSLHVDYIIVLQDPGPLTPGSNVSFLCVGDAKRFEWQVNGESPSERFQPMGSTGNTLVLFNVRSSDNGSSLRCIAQADGRGWFDGNKDYQLHVLPAPTPITTNGDTVPASTRSAATSREATLSSTTPSLVSINAFPTTAPSTQDKAVRIMVQCHHISDKLLLTWSLTNNSGIPVTRADLLNRQMYYSVTLHVSHQRHMTFRVKYSKSHLLFAKSVFTSHSPLLFFAVSVKLVSTRPGNIQVIALSPKQLFSSSTDAQLDPVSLRRAAVRISLELRTSCAMQGRWAEIAGVGMQQLFRQQQSCKYILDKARVHLRHHALPPPAACTDPDAAVQHEWTERFNITASVLLPKDMAHALDTLLQNNCFAPSLQVNASVADVLSVCLQRKRRPEKCILLNRTMPTTDTGAATTSSTSPASRLSNMPGSESVNSLPAESVQSNSTVTMVAVEGTGKPTLFLSTVISQPAGTAETSKRPGSPTVVVGPSEGGETGEVYDADDSTGSTEGAGLAGTVTIAVVAATLLTIVCIGLIVVIFFYHRGRRTGHAAAAAAA